MKLNNIAKICIFLPGFIQAETVKANKKQEVKEKTSQVKSSKQNTTNKTKEEKKEANSVKPEVINSVVSNLNSNYILLDKIDSIVCGSEKNTPITATDINWKRDLTNKFIPLQKQIETEIVNQQIVSEKIPMEPDAAEKYVKSIQKQNNFSEADMTHWFNEVGRTYKEGLDLLMSQYNNEYFLHHKFKSQLAPTEEEILAYYEDNPEFIEATVKLRATRVPYDSQANKEELKADLEAMIKQELEKKESEIVWSEPVIAIQEDLSDDQLFLLDMKPGEIKLIDDENEHYFGLYQLLENNPASIVSLEDRRTMIVDILNRKALEKMFSDYNKAVKEYIEVIKFS